MDTTSAQNKRWTRWVSKYSNKIHCNCHFINADNTQQQCTTYNSYKEKNAALSNVIDGRTTAKSTQHNKQTLKLANTRHSKVYAVSDQLKNAYYNWNNILTSNGCLNTAGCKNLQSIFCRHSTGKELNQKHTITTSALTDNSESTRTKNIKTCQHIWKIH